MGHGVKSLLPVPVAPELISQIRFMTLHISKRCFTLDPVHNVTIDR